MAQGTRIKKINLGYTLAEVLVAMTVFSVVTTAVFTVYIKGIGYYRKLGGGITDFRMPAVALDKIWRELTCDAEKIIYPPEEKLRPTEESTWIPPDSIVFSTFLGKYIGYIFSSNELAIKRVIYSNFDPHDLSDQQLATNPRVIADNIKSINYYLDTSNALCILIKFKSADKEHLFATKAYIR